MELFLLGALGALLTIYLTKEVVIPEFRPLFDISEVERETIGLREHIKQIEERIDDILTELKKGSPQSDISGLNTGLIASQSQLSDERIRLQKLERDIKQCQIISRSLGFIFYIVLGGVFGSLLANKIQIEGVGGGLQYPFMSIMIGASWTSYLSVIGSRLGHKKAIEKIEEFRNRNEEISNAVIDEITDMVYQEVGKAEKGEKVEQPIYADAVAKKVHNRLHKARSDMQKHLNLTGKMIKSDMKGIL